MNPNRESELRRKLEMTEIPAPPPGLADRIVSEIPEELFPAKGVTAPLRPRFFPMQVAASLLLLAGAAYMATRVFTANEEVVLRPATVAEQKSAPMVATANEVTITAPTVPAVAQPEGDTEPPSLSRLDTSARPATAAPVVIADATSGRRVEERRQAAAQEEMTAEDQMEARENSAGFSEQTEIVAVTAEAPAVAESRAMNASPAPPPAAAPAAPAAPARVAVADAAAGSTAKTMGVVIQGRARGATSRLETSAPVPPQSVLAAEASVFGISIDEASVARVRATLDRGERPVAASVNSEAFVSYFAGPHTRPSSNVSLDVEGSAPPASTGVRTVLMRFSVDTAPGNITGRPAGRDAKIDVELNPRVVARHRRIGGDSRLSAAEPLLLRDVSVTAVYELELLPLSAPPQKAVTVKLRYRDPDSGREKSLVKALHVRDFARGWEKASLRHRMATLGGLLSESLQGTPTGVDLARRAEELAKEAPKDERARELANVATASSRLRSSAPTGSGR